MQDKHQWISHTLLDMAAFCELNGMVWQREILLDTVSAFGGYQSDLIAARSKISSMLCGDGAPDRKQADQAHAA